MPAGRPTKYTKELLDNARDYLKTYEDKGDMIPSVEGLVLTIDIDRATAYRWANEEDKEEFRDILEKINATQKNVLINKGLNNQFNSNIAKLVLGKHGLHDKIDQNNKHSGLVSFRDVSTMTTEEIKEEEEALKRELEE